MNDTRSDTTNRLKILGYISGQTAVTEQDARNLTHLNVAFARLRRDGAVDPPGLPVCEPDRLARLRAWNPALKIAVSVVAGDPDAFTRVAASPALRAAAAASLAALVRQHHFDGVDFDWEYPCVPSNGQDASPADRVNFTHLCRETRRALDAGAPGRLLSIAAGADLYYVESVEVAALQGIVDHLCLMTYDLKCGFHALSGHHTALYSSTGDYFRNSCDQALRLFHAAGVPYHKLLCGAAFYSRKWEGVPGRNHGMLQLCPAGAGYGPRYADLVRDYVNRNGYTRYWDDEAKAPWLFNGSTFLSYDDEESVALKCRYVRAHGLGGIFYWEHGGDPTGTLLGVMARECRRDGGD